MGNAAIGGRRLGFLRHGTSFRNRSRAIAASAGSGGRVRRPGRPSPLQDFVDGLDLAVAGFGLVAAKKTGRPGYGPADLLKLYVYGYINRAIQPAAGGEGPSQHRSHLAAAAQRHLRTIGDLRRVSGRPSSRYSASWHILCRQPDLFVESFLRSIFVHQCGEQQASQLQAWIVDHVHQPSRRETRLHEAAR